ncbi:unnamed protein product [Boreogadus saida]
MTPKVDYSELKKVIDALRDEVAAVKEKQIEIHRLLEKLTAIDTENKYRDEKIRELDDRMTDLEQYSRINDIIISGLRIRPRSFARAVATNNGSRTEPEEEDVASAEQQVTHDYHCTGEKSVPTPLSCTSVLQSWTKDTGDSLQGIRPEPTDQLVVRKPKRNCFSAGYLG